MRALRRMFEHSVKLLFNWYNYSVEISMLFTARRLGDMGAPPVPTLQPSSRYFPQWSRTAILTYGGGEEPIIQVS